MEDVIISAIENMQCLEVEYDGHIRIVEPHCYGRGSNGQALLRCFQVSGGSNSGKTHDWKLFRVDRMGRPRTHSSGFTGPRPGYNPNGDRHIPYVIKKL